MSESTEQAAPSGSTADLYNLLHRNWSEGQKYYIQHMFVYWLNQQTRSATHEQKVALFEVFCKTHPNLPLSVIAMINAMLTFAGLQKIAAVVPNAADMEFDAIPYIDGFVAYSVPNIPELNGHKENTK